MKASSGLMVSMRIKLLKISVNMKQSNIFPYVHPKARNIIAHAREWSKIGTK